MVHPAVLLPPLFGSIDRTIRGTAQSGFLDLEITYGSPFLLQCSELVAKGYVVMYQLCPFEVFLCEILPTPLRHLTPVAVPHVNLVTIQLTKDLSVVITPLSPVKLVLKY
jgi:hypothetical protein